MIELEHNQRVLYQWDLKKRVVLDGFLPRTKVEFSSKYDHKDSALTVYAYVDSGHVVADIPNELLQTAGYLHVYVRPPASDVVHAPEQKDIKVVKRDKPEDYACPMTPTESLENKVNKYWGPENAGKTLVIGEDGYLVAAEPKPSSGSITTEDDGEGNVEVTISGMSVTDDGAGNITVS